MGIRVNVKLDAYQKGVPALIPLPGKDDLYKILIIDENGKYILSDDLIQIKRKLDGIEDGAQVNIIEAIKVAGTKLPIDQNKAVNVPKASDSTYGVVKGKDQENFCRVNDQGELYVDELNVEKLVQDGRLILDCN